MEDMKTRREGFEQMGKRYPKAETVQVEKDSISGVDCYWFKPGKPVPKKIIIYLHGGVYAVGSIRSHESMVSHFSQQLKSTILFIDYALAPEYPYPAAKNNVLDVYIAILKDYPGYEIGLFGDSAGGGLIVALAGELLNQDIPLPYSVAMISPWINLSDSNSSQESNRTKDRVLNKEYLQVAAKNYAGQYSLDTISPDKVVLTNFPPVLITVGSNEILLDDSVKFYDVVKKMQPKSTLTIYPDQYHVWPLADINSDASVKLLVEMSGFFGRQSF